jgi:hypothetical protein
LRRAARLALAAGVAALAAAALAGPAAAKLAELEAGVLSLCGPETCVPIDDEAAVAWIDELLLAEDPAPGATPAPGTFYELRYTELAGEETRPLGWVVPQAGVVRAYLFSGSGSHSEWYSMTPGARDAMARTVLGVEPFPPPELESARAGGRPAGDVAAYLGLLADLPETFRPAAGGDRLDVELVPATLTPWTVTPAYRLAYAPAENAIRLAPRWFEVPGALAERIELDAGLRSPPAGTSPGGSAGSTAAATATGVLMLAVLGWAARRRRSPGPATPRPG